MAMSPRGVGAVFSLVICGKLAEKVDVRWLTNAGWLFMAYSAWSLGNVTLDITVGSIGWPNIFSGVALGFLFVPLTTAALAELSNEQMGNASGIFNLARNVGGGIGISLTTTWVARGAQAHQALMVGRLDPYAPEFQQRFHAIAGGLSQYSDPLTAQRQAYGMLYGIVQQQANLFAYVDTFRFLAFLCLLCIPIVFLLKKAKSSGGSVAMH
jgi:MFS transporter, DHA2 family, multidrug resistance protein